MTKISPLPRTEMDALLLGRLDVSRNKLYKLLWTFSLFLFVVCMPVFIDKLTIWRHSMVKINFFFKQVFIGYIINFFLIIKQSGKILEGTDSFFQELNRFFFFIIKSPQRLPLYQSQKLLFVKKLNEMSLPDINLSFQQSS